MGDIKVKSWPSLAINAWPGMDVNAWPDIRFHSQANILRLKEIAPAAVHIKELNNVDPLTVESLKIDKVANLDPIRIEEFNVTRLPMVNLALRQMPALDMNIRRLPPVSIGLHQNVHIPSKYTLKARFFGVEFFRVNMDGHTMLVPKDRVHREESRTHDRSYALPAAVGNPSIPVKRTVRTTVTVSPGPPNHCHHQHHTGGYTAPASMRHQRGPQPTVNASSPGSATSSNTATFRPARALSFGQPSTSVSLPPPHARNEGSASVSIGGL